MPSIFDADPIISDPSAPPTPTPTPTGASPRAADIFAADPLITPTPAQPAPAPTVPADTGFDAGTDALARSATFGLSDVVGAAGGATGRALHRFTDWLTGGASPADTGTWSGDYQQLLAQNRAAGEAFAAAHPYLNLGANVLGAAGAAAPAEAATGLVGLGRQIATGAGLGAAGGAASALPAATSAPTWRQSGEDIAAGAGTGAVAGAALPPALAIGGRLLAPLARALLPNAAENQATRVIANRIGQDVAAGGTTIPDLQAAIAGFPTGKPLNLADIGEASNLQALAGKVARAPGESRTIALNAFGDRTSEAAQRIVDDVNQGLSPDTAFGTEQTLLGQRRAAAAPAYRNFYAQPALNPDAVAPDGELTQLMQRPSMRSAANRALGIAQEEGRDPNSLGLTFNAAGDPVFQQVPSWQTLDYIKRGLDDHLDQWRTPFGTLQLDENGRAVLGTQKAFVDFLDDNNPAYAAARDAYAGPSAALAALRQGQNFRSFTPDQLTSMFGSGANALNASEQDFFRIGAADTLRQGAQRTGDVRGIIGSNQATQRGATYMADQLRPLFTDPQAYQSFVDRAQAEAQMLQTQGRVIGGAPTAARVGEDVGGGVGSAAGPLITGALALPHEPWLGATQLATGISRLANLPEISAPEVNAAVARRLYSADPLVQRQTLNDVLALRPPTGVRMAPTAGRLAGLLVPGLWASNAPAWARLPGQ